MIGEERWPWPRASRPSRPALQPASAATLATGHELVPRALPRHLELLPPTPAGTDPLTTVLAGRPAQETAGAPIDLIDRRSEFARLPWVFRPGT